MHGHALIIGSQTHELTAPLHDARRVAEAMEARGFGVDLRVGAEATRDGILQGYRHLIDVCTQDSAAFIYYAGHGAMSSDSVDGIPFIVPVDFEASTQDDFRGITLFELSGLLEVLTAKTRNVSVVIDCCFAAGLFRNEELVPRSLAEVPVPTVSALLTRLQTRGLPVASRSVMSNPHAVRLVAAALDEAAYECTNTRGSRSGLLTDAFLGALEEARGLRVSWGQLGRRVRERVLAVPKYQQRPELHGPVRRLLFQLEELDQDHSLAYYRDQNRHWLRGGRLHGVCVGDEYAVMPPGALGLGEQALVRARVIHALAGSSQVELEWRPSLVIPVGAPAFRVRSAQVRRVIALEGAWEEDSPFHRLLRERIDGSPLVRLAAQGGQEPVIASVRLRESGVDVLDQGADPIIHPLPALAPSVTEVVRALEVQAQAQDLRDLEGSEGEARLGDVLEFEWGRVFAGRQERLATAGARLRVGERIYLRFRNKGAADIFINIFDIGIAGGITLLNTLHPLGIKLKKSQEEVLGRTLDKAEIVGLPLEWPRAVPRDGMRPESLVIIVTDTQLDLRSREPPSDRTTRAPSPVQASHQRYDVEHIRFWLDPRPAR